MVVDDQVDPPVSPEDTAGSLAQPASDVREVRAVKLIEFLFPSSHMIFELQGIQEPTTSASGDVQPMEGERLPSTLQKRTEKTAAKATGKQKARAELKTFREERRTTNGSTL